MNVFVDRRWKALLFAPCALILLLPGCAALPSSGPTGHEVVRPIGDPLHGGPLQIVEVSDVASLPAIAVPASSSLIEPETSPTDLLGPGDALDIVIYEAGVALFGGTTAATGGFDPGAKAEKLPTTRIDDGGYIQLPFIGRVHVAGQTISQVETQLRGGLRGMSQNPQVLVAIHEVITNSVIVGGEVGKPGRLVLPTNHETLSDAIALAGGYRGEAKDLVVRISRRGRDSQTRLTAVLNDASQDARVYPGDRILVLRAPRSFTVMGAPGKVDLVSFSAANESLAEAMATVGGTNPYLGDPKAIFVFRVVSDEAGKERSVVYHINMMKTGSYFLAQRFAMRDKDILYIGNARANQPSKLVQIISQLFSPLATVAAGVSVVR